VQRRPHVAWWRGHPISNQHLAGVIDDPSRQAIRPDVEGEIRGHGEDRTGRGATGLRSVSDIARLPLRAVSVSSRVSADPRAMSEGASTRFAALFDGISANIAKVVHGKRETIDLSLVCLLAEGHLLIEDVPGVGKTSLAKAIAASIDCSWKRVQFTPDLLPSDLVGVSIFQRTTETWKFQPGPLFANIVLADEINRASPKTQSALLESMEERTITVDGTTHQLEAPFMVIATQNPVEQEGTYRLPESQLDRFLFRLSLGYPGRAAELAILDGRGAAGSLPGLEPVVSGAEIVQMIEAVRTVFLADPLRGYLVDLAEASRRHPAIELGLSPRATLQMAAAARAHAAARGRNYATPDDVKVVAGPALTHRLMLRTDRGGRLDPADAVRELLADVPVPITRH
jgi:MoxR-like ATPase